MSAIRVKSGLTKFHPIIIIMMTMLLGDSSIGFAQEIIVAVFPESNNYFDRMGNGMRIEADRRHADLQFRNYRQTSEIGSVVEDLIAQNVNNIVLVSSALLEIEPTIRIAAENGARVVAVQDVVTPVPGLSAVVGPNIRQGGAAQAKWIAASFAHGTKILSIDGPAESGWANLRTDGFKEALNTQGSNYPIVSQLMAATFSEIGGDNMTVVSQLADSADVFVAPTDQIALGVLPTIKERNEKAMLMGFGATPEGLRAVKEGRMAATVELFPGDQGRKAINVILDLAEGIGPSACQVWLMEAVVVTTAALNDAVLDSSDGADSVCWNSGVKTCCPIGDGFGSPAECVH